MRKIEAIELAKSLVNLEKTGQPFTFRRKDGTIEDLNRVCKELLPTDLMELYKADHGADYSIWLEHYLGVNWSSLAWIWLFSPTWAHYDDTAGGLANRLLLLVDREGIAPITDEGEIGFSLRVVGNTLREKYGIVADTKGYCLGLDEVFLDTKPMSEEQKQGLAQLINSDRIQLTYVYFTADTRADSGYAITQSVQPPIGKLSGHNRIEVGLKRFIEVFKYNTEGK